MKCLSPVKIRNPNWDTRPWQYRYLKVPCGKCTACLSNKRREWSFRLEKEVEVSSSAFFITLTYDNDNCPICVNKKDCQNFLKRFRKSIEPHRIRYFLVSEYGDEIGRPHYHLLLFNYPFDLPSLRATLKKTWCLCSPDWFDRNDTVKPAHPANINYVAKYCLSNLDNDDPFSRTFMLSSRRPGIGLSYLTPAMVNYLKGRLDGSTVHHGFPMSLPRYYTDKVFDEYEKETMKLMRQGHEFDELNRVMKEYNCDEVRAHDLITESNKHFDKKVREKLKNGFNNVQNHFYNNERQKAEAKYLLAQSRVGNSDGCRKIDDYFSGADDPR